MRKKTIALLLSIVFILSLCPSAFAAEQTLDSQLTAVTQIVKDTLGIGDEYTSFYGELNDKGVSQYWSLTWSKDSESLNVSADENGKIFNYSRNINNEFYRYNYDFAPAFPKVSREAAKQAAIAFLDKVLSKNESYSFTDDSAIQNPSDTERYYFSSILKLNGLDSPTYISISVLTKDLSITNFNRGDLYNEFIGDVPSAEPVTSKEDAFALLSGTMKMNLQYVLDSTSAGDTTKSYTAVLRYLPVYSGNYVVNAKTGKLINMDDLYNRAASNGYGGGIEAGSVAATADSSGKTALTEAELAGIAKLNGALTKDQLDEKARAITELGLLPEFTFNSVNYSLNNETGEVTAYLSYTQKAPGTDATKTGTGSFEPISADKAALMAAAGEIRFIYKSVTLDAKTGALKSVSTSYPYSDYSSIEKDRVSLEPKAVAFLTKFFNAYYTKSALYEGNPSVIPYYDYNSYSPDVSFTYSQFANGYFFPTNTMNVSVNAETGFIDSFNMSWTDNVTFESADGIITNEEACKSYSNAYQAKLSYIQLPVAIDPTRPELQKYIQYGYSYVYELCLAYTLYSVDSITGVNAKTGEVIKNAPYTAAKPTVYTDIQSSYAKTQIEKLAQFGIGFPGTSYKLKKQLTQLDMVLLLMSADGYKMNDDQMTEEEINSVYSAAYYRNVLKKEDKNPTKLITRSDLIRTILTMSGYSKTADLKGIYVCKFNDAASIKIADYGYFAIAQGLGIINGDNKGNANPNAVVTREQAAVMLFNFMSR